MDITQCKDKNLTRLMRRGESEVNLSDNLSFTLIFTAINTHTHRSGLTHIKAHDRERGDEKVEE